LLETKYSLSFPMYVCMCSNITEQSQSPQVALPPPHYLVIHTSKHSLSTGYISNES
jgi:hypothetical protein